MRRAVLWDSSAILGILDADDADHRRADEEWSLCDVISFAVLADRWDRTALT